MTTRVGGVSSAPFDALNLGYATQDARASVSRNELLVAGALGVSSDDFRWVYQVHGVEVHHAEALPANVPLGSTVACGDAVVSHTPGLVCAVKVADCMPVLFAAADGSAVAAAHAGWRGLATGVLERTVAACGVAPDRLAAWLGPCIGPGSFEVGEDVRDAFVAHDAAAAQHFAPRAEAGKFLCDLWAIARQRLAACGLTEVTGSGLCTYTRRDLFFSHRRDRVTGRMAAFVWIERA
jgi:YfiH family protein